MRQSDSKRKRLPDHPVHPWWHPQAAPPKGKRPKGRAHTGRVQLLIFKRSEFAAKSAARGWSKRHGFRCSTVVETPSSYRIEQLPRSSFRPGTLKVAELAKGVRARCGQLRKG